MSRYDWPAPGRGTRGRRPARAAWNVSRDAGADLRLVPAPGATPQPRLAPAGRTELWLPLGPTTTLDGTAQHRPRTAGRCRDVAANPADPRRVYVASALGGLWYSENFGASWEQVGAYTTLADRTQARPSSTTLSAGAVYVVWGATAADDEVWIGTGEPDPLHQPYDRGYKGQFSGVGILFARGPVTSVRTNPNADPWTRQAQPRAGYEGLRGASVFSFVRDPADPRRIAAATTRGLHVHDPGAAAGTDPWSLVTVAAWDAAAGSPGSARVVVTDVAWVASGAVSRLWASLRQSGTPLTGVWRSDNGAAGPFTEVPLLAMRTAAGAPAVDRIALAAAPSNPDVLYVMSSGSDSAARLQRVDGAAAARLIVGRPGRPFFGDPRPGDSDQSDYDMCIEVDPDNPRRFMIGGAFTEAPDGSLAAAVFRLTVPAATPPAGSQWRTDYAGRQGSDPTWVGEEIHPDVHRIRWVRSGADVHVFICTDGGVYHSARGGDAGTYVSRASGMSVTEEVFSVSHPDSDGVVLSGVQDNGVQLRIGDGVWRRAIMHGDGGGVAFDPGLHGRFIAQATRSLWSDDDGTMLAPTFRFDSTGPFWTEHRASCFYSNTAAIANGPTTQLVVGTTRIWYSEEWGRSFPDALNPFLTRRMWATLPSLTDPRAGDAANTTRDVIPPGPLPPGTIDVRGVGVRVIRWAGVDRLYVLMPGSVHRFDRAAAVWARTQIELRPTMPVNGVPPPVPPMAAGGPHLPPDGSLNDLAVHQAARGPHGSFYVATSHPEEPVWWFDGDHTFHPCGLGAVPSPAPPVPGAVGGVKAPAYAVVIDPTDDAVVYVGTALGVYRGALTFAAGAPSWTWRDLNNGLPEAAVQDLTIDTWTRPAGGTVTLMRACLQSRGVWEVDLRAPVVDLTFVRAHPYDTRRIMPSPMLDPLHRPEPDRANRDWPLDWGYTQNRDHRVGAAPAPHPDGTARNAFLWHASPDIRVRPAPGSTALAVPVAAAGLPFPWTPAAPPTDRFALWALQTALHAIDDRVVPDGQWTSSFERRVTEIRASRGLLPAGARVDAGLWNHVDVRAGFWADPWAPGGPSEADLVERVVGMRTPRPGAAAVTGASVALPAGPSRVEVCVHRRGLDAAPRAGVGVLLLLREVVEPVAAWGTIAVPAVTGLAALDALPVGGGALPAAVTLPAGWVVADTAVNVRRPPRDVRTAESAVVSFTVDFTGRTGVWLLLALVRHGGTSPDLTIAPTMSALVAASPHVTARTVQLV